MPTQVVLIKIIASPIYLALSQPESKDQFRESPFNYQQKKKMCAQLAQLA
jgi:hypothetical protein